VPEITPESHRYVGMWRPPLESLTHKDVPVEQLFCPCGAAEWEVRWGIIWHHNAKMSRTERVTGEFKREFVDHYLAGHFDTPIYEPKPMLSVQFPTGANFDDIKDSVCPTGDTK